MDIISARHLAFLILCIVIVLFSILFDDTGEPEPDCEYYENDDE